MCCAMSSILMVFLYSTRENHLPYALLDELLFCEMFSSNIFLFPFFC